MENEIIVNDEIITGEVLDTPVVESEIDIVEDTIIDETITDESEVKEPEENSDNEDLPEDEIEETFDGVVTAAHLNVRKEASKDSDIISIVAKDDEVKITDEIGDFYKVLVNDVEGFCVKDFITIK